MHPYLLILLRWSLLALVIFAVTVLGGVYLIDRMLPKVYLATAQVQVDLPPESATGQPAEFQPEFETIQSPLVLNATIAQLNLKQAWSKRLFSMEPGPMSDARALTYLTSILKIERIPGTNRIDISAASDDPQEAAAIANAVTDEYKARREMPVPLPAGQTRGTQVITVSVSDTAMHQTITTGTTGQVITQVQKIIDEDRVALDRTQDVSRSAGSPQAIAYAALQQEYAQAREVLQLLQKHQLMESRATITIVSRPRPGTVPTRPNRDLSLALGIVVGFTLSLLIPTLTELGLWLARAARIRRAS